MSSDRPSSPPDSTGGLRVAVIGTGFVGAVHVRSARLAGARVVGVAASTPERSEAARARLGADRSAPAEDLVVADDIDVVHIAAPNNVHEALATAALRAGKDVVLEKPIALDGAGADAVADVAADCGRLVAVPFVNRFHPVIRQGRWLVDEGQLGPVHLIHGSYQQDWLSRVTDDNWRSDAVVGGASRAFADIGSHWVDLVEFVTGHQIVNVLANVATVLPERVAAGSRAAFSTGDADGPRRAVTTEDIAVVTFETDRGALGSVVVSQMSPGRKNRLWFEIDGTDAAVSFDQEDPERLWVGRREGSGIVVKDPGHLSPDATRLAVLPPGHGQGYHDCFDLFVADAYRAIRSGVLPEGLPTIVDGVAAAHVTDAVLASAAARSWTPVKR